MRIQTVGHFPIIIHVIGITVTSSQLAFTTKHQTDRNNKTGHSVFSMTVERIDLLHGTRLLQAHFFTLSASLPGLNLDRMNYLAFLYTVTPVLANTNTIHYHRCQYCFLFFSVFLCVPLFKEPLSLLLRRPASLFFETFCVVHGQRSDHPEIVAHASRDICAVSGIVLYHIVATPWYAKPGKCRTGAKAQYCGDLAWPEDVTCQKRPGTQTRPRRTINAERPLNGTTMIFRTTKPTRVRATSALPPETSWR